MILIKDRHNVCNSISFPPITFGKYDTYKGSTPTVFFHFLKPVEGNMILIKDRHFYPLKPIRRHHVIIWEI